MKLDCAGLVWIQKEVDVIFGLVDIRRVSRMKTGCFSSAVIFRPHLQICPLLNTVVTKQIIYSIYGVL
jgi:hypothetical protein